MLMSLVYLIVRRFKANAHAERWVRTVRRECLDHLLVLSRRHLNAVLAEFVEHYNRARPHRSLGLDTPESGSRPTRPPGTPLGSVARIGSVGSSASTRSQRDRSFRTPSGSQELDVDEGAVLPGSSGDRVNVVLPSRSLAVATAAACSSSLLATRSSRLCPMASAAVYPNSRSADRFQATTFASRSVTTIAIGLISRTGSKPLVSLILRTSVADRFASCPPGLDYPSLGRW